MKKYYDKTYLLIAVICVISAGVIPAILLPVHSSMIDYALLSDNRFLLYTGTLVLLMLDEPTSALDALQEKRMYQAFAAQLEGKSGIIITHRLGMVQVSNQIIVLSHGEIAEQGTHNELILKSGLYASMWERQAQQYA